MKTIPMLLIALLIGLPRMAAADYVMTLLHGGDTSLVAVPGTRFSVTVDLRSDAADLHNSVLFRVVFSEPGLVLESYEWSAPYENGTLSDFSTPRLNTLPQVIDADSYNNGDSVVDVYLSNVTAGSFGAGTLLTLSFYVPPEFAGPSQVSMQVVPDTLSLGFNPPVPTFPGPMFLVNIGFRILGLTFTPGADEGVLSWASKSGLFYDVLLASVPGGVETNVLENVEGLVDRTSVTVPMTEDRGVFRVQQHAAP
jgi:hypothetical protein